jgi:hypothetical protein
MEIELLTRIADTLDLVAFGVGILMVAAGVLLGMRLSK